MDLNKLAGQAKKMLDKRGGVDSVKEDLLELKNIAGEKASLAEKAKEAAAALSDPGAPGDPVTDPAQTPTAP